MTAMVVMGSEPLPPYSSGTGRPCTPKAAHFFQPSWAKVRWASRSIMSWFNSLRAKSIADFCNDCWSGVRSKSIGCLVCWVVFFLERQGRPRGSRRCHERPSCCREPLVRPLVMVKQKGTTPPTFRPSWPAPRSDGSVRHAGPRCHQTTSGRRRRRNRRSSSRAAASRPNRAVARRSSAGCEAQRHIPCTRAQVTGIVIGDASPDPVPRAAVGNVHGLGNRPRPPTHRGTRCGGTHQGSRPVADNPAKAVHAMRAMRNDALRPLAVPRSFRRSPCSFRQLLEQ
jgi:hypothetical protein